MDWARAIERNSEALKAIVAALFVMLGSQAVARLPRPLHRAVLSVLRPAESAVRRLIVIAARGLVAKPAAARPMPQGPIGRGGRNRKPRNTLSDQNRTQQFQWVKSAEIRSLRVFRGVQSSVLSALRSQEALRASAPRNRPPGATAHPLLRQRSHGGGLVVVTAKCRARCAAR